MSRYDPAAIEPKWQVWWAENETFKVSNESDKPKYYALGMFPYPSGSGLHVGHPESYTALDIVSRYKRMNGFNVLQPMGWDAFGLPAERAAMRDGRHPADITRENIANFKRQLMSLGFGYDWSREVNTSEINYYRWTQWIFLKLHEQGLAYLAEVPVWWCPAQGTVLANEEVQDGKYVETGEPVVRRSMKQWMLKITAYAQRLLDDLDGLDWPAGVLQMQREWIGRSEGAEVTFKIQGSDEAFTVYTTRPDTLFGATYCVLAPEHALVEAVTSDARRAEVTAYVNKARNRSERDRQANAEKEKTGVFTGGYAINPVNGQPVPIWVADYVLISYGTGAIMAVPAHDERDHAFATKFDLPIIQVIAPKADDPDHGEVDVQVAAWASKEGVGVNSGDFDGQDFPTFFANIVSWLEDKGLGEKKVNFKLRDWLFSRQRYWGEPFPILHGPNGEIRPVEASELPVGLPHIDEYKPTEDGDPPLARAGEAWSTVEIDGVTYTRETNTMPQWAGSCWYYLRYMDPTNTELPFSKEAEQYWGPVDLYIGGVEHAVLHLLYARFWHKVLYDCGLVSTVEPFKKLYNQGMILAHAYRESGGKYHKPDDAERRVGENAEIASPWNLEQTVETDWYVGDTPVERKLGKMGKSLMNSVDPLDVVKDYGADALRIYEMFMGPLEQVKPWQMSGVEGVSRFLARLWRLYIAEDGTLNPDIGDHPSDRELDRALHTTIKAVTDGIEDLRFNTPVSRMMEFVKLAIKKDKLPRDVMERFVLVLSPYAPHLGEELWQRLGHSTTLADEPWPQWDEAALKTDNITLAVQVQGKLRGQIEIPADTSKGDALRIARENPNVCKFLDDMDIVKEVFVPGRLINFVVRPRRK